MKAVKVTYTTKAEYVEQNKLNIQKVMSDLREQKTDNIFYHCCVGDDGTSFIHTAFFQSDDDEKILNALPSFRDFQQQLKASGPLSPPRVEILGFVGSSREIFK